MARLQRLPGAALAGQAGLAAAAQAGERRIWLDRNAVPTLEIESEGNVVDHRVPGAYIDIEAVLALAEAAHQIDVFEVLGVRKHSSSVLPASMPQNGPEEGGKGGAVDVSPDAL